MDGSSILDRFRRLYTSEFGGSTIPADAEFWLHGVERVFGVLAVPEQQNISLASFNLKGDALAWWENYYRQLTTVDDGVAPRVVTWDMFVRGFNNKYCPPSYRLDRENTFLYLKQGSRSVAEYEAEFASLSRFAVDLVSTDERRCQRFRHGLNEGIASRLISFRERDYADLVDMASRIGQDIVRMAEKRARSNDSGAGNFSGRSGFSKDGSGRSHFKKPYDRNQSGKGETKQNSGEQSVNRGSFDGQRCYKCDKLGHIARN